MEEVICSCTKCDAELGQFKNAWNRIGTTYYSPVHPLVNYITGFEATGKIYQPPAGSPVENSYIQDVTCRNCQDIIGVRCDRAPEGHLLKPNQILLRLSQLSVVSIQTGMKAIVSVQEKFSIRPPGVKKPELLQRAATVQPSPRPQTPKPSAFRKSMNGSMPPPPATDRTRELDTFKTWAQDAITKQKMDIACVSTAVERIETGMRGFQDFMNQVRTELAANRGENPTQKDIMALRDDVRDLRKEFGTNQQTQQSKPQEHAKIFDQKLATLQDHVYSLGESAVTKEHLEVLIDDIQRVYQKTSYLQEDLGVLKRKHRIMETISSKTRLTPNQDSVDQEAGVSSEDVFPRSSDAVIDLTAGDDFVDPIAPEYSTSHSQDKPIAADSTTSRTIDSTPFTRGGEEVMTRPLREEQGSGKLKRKHNNADDSPAQSEPLTKRTRKSLGQPIKEHVPLSTSNGDSLPIPNNPAIAQLKGRKGMRPVSLGNPAKGPVRSAGRPRTMSLANTPTNLLAAPEQPLSLPNFESQPPNLSVPKQRGSATTAAATSSNQSLRQKRRSGNKENEVPDSSSHTVLDSDSPSEYITTATPIPMNDTPVPSIERDSFAIVIPVSKELDRQTRQGGNSRIFEASRALFVCHFCGKEYKHAGSLKTHSLKCVGAEEDGTARQKMDEARKKTLLERDALVRRALERNL